MANIKKNRKKLEFIITEEMKRQPEYVFVGEYRYDSNLTSGAKILLSEIIALSITKGYCDTTNQEFAKLFHKSVRTIQKYIEELVDLEYLLSETIRNDNNEVVERKLTPTVI